VGLFQSLQSGRQGMLSRAITGRSS
jgi:hypothetical protein